MSNLNILFHKINEHNNKIDNLKVKSVLILYDRNFFFIGDTCIQLARLKKIKSYYSNSIIDINTTDHNLYCSIKAILANNPYINSYINSSWDKIAFEKYDVIICACLPEKKFVDFIVEKHFKAIEDGTFSSAIYTASESVGFDENKDETRFFPTNNKFINFKLSENDEKSMNANELFISENERTWANEWLESSGIEANDDLIILFDNSSSREKLLKITVYFETLTALIKNSKTKVLIFDEKKWEKGFFIMNG